MRTTIIIDSEAAITAVIGHILAHRPVAVFVASKEAADKIVEAIGGDVDLRILTTTEVGGKKTFVFKAEIPVKAAPETQPETRGFADPS